MTLILYEDKGLTKPFNVINLIEVEVGTSKSKDAYLANIDEKFVITAIKESFTDEDVSVVNMPNELKPKESAPITITFKPSLNRDKGLHTDIFFSGKMIKP
mgnify:CR=1 FL=1